MRHIRCNVCGNDDAAVLLKSRDRTSATDMAIFTLVRCRHCRLVYVDPQPSSEELVPYYTSAYPPYQTESRTFSPSPFLQVLRKIKSVFVPKNSSAPAQEKAADESEKTVLDFGCGSGGFLLALQKMHPHWKLVGFDISSNTQVHSLGKGISLVSGRMEDLERKFPPATFDIVYSNNVLEHVNDPSDTLARLSRLLKKEGRIFIEVPNIQCWKFTVFGKHYSSLDMPRHLYHFSPQTLAALVEKNGLRMVSCAYVGSTKSTLRSLYFFLGIKTAALNPLLFKIFDFIAKLFGEKRINTDAIRIEAVKSFDTP